MSSLLLLGAGSANARITEEEEVRITEDRETRIQKEG